jgi:hypothetical protein
MRVKGRHTWFSQQKCAGDLADFQRKDVFVLQLSSESCSLFERQGSIESIVTHMNLVKSQSSPTTGKLMFGSGI